MNNYRQTESRGVCKVCTVQYGLYQRVRARSVLCARKTLERGHQQIAKCQDLTQLVQRGGAIDYRKLYLDISGKRLAADVEIDEGRLVMLQAMVLDEFRRGKISRAEIAVLTLNYGMSERRLTTRRAYQLMADCCKALNQEQAIVNFAACSSTYNYLLVEVLNEVFWRVFNMLRERFIMIECEVKFAQLQTLRHEFDQCYQERLREIAEGGAFDTDVGYYSLNYPELYYDLYGVDVSEAWLASNPQQDVVKWAINYLAKRYALSRSDLVLLELCYGKHQCKLAEYPQPMEFFSAKTTYEELLETMRRIFMMIRCVVIG